MVVMSAGAGNFSLFQDAFANSGAHPAFHSIGTRALSSGVKRPRRGTDYSPVSSTKVKNERSYNPTPYTPL
jgi:hypothetical protein